jgi:hypothetical protein
MRFKESLSLSYNFKRFCVYSNLLCLDKDNHISSGKTNYPEDFDYFCSFSWNNQKKQHKQETEVYI